MPAPPIPDLPEASNVPQEIADVWREMLHRDDIPSDADFFQLGGTQQMVEPMLQGLQATLQLPPFSREGFLQEPTRAGLSRLIRNLILERKLTALPGHMISVPVQTGTGQPTLYVMPPHLDDGTGLRRLGPALGSDWTLTFLRPDTTAYDMQQPFLVENAGRDAAAEILRIQPQGKPFLLAGHCFAGSFAWEAARLLQGAGCLGLILFDAPMAGHPFPTMDPRRSPVRQYLRELRKSTRVERQGLSFANFLPRRLLWHGIMRSRSFLQYTWQGRKTQRLISASLRSDVPCFHDPRGLHLPVLHFLAEHEPSRMLAESRRGWQFVSRGPFRNVVIPGDHGGLFFRRNLPVLAGAIRDWSHESGLLNRMR